MVKCAGPFACTPIVPQARSIEKYENNQNSINIYLYWRCIVVTIRNLEIFAAVCKYMSMSKAAENLMVSQSSVSQAISTLEKEFHVILFERLNHISYRCR